MAVLRDGDLGTRQVAMLSPKLEVLAKSSALTFVRSASEVTLKTSCYALHIQVERVWDEMLWVVHLGARRVHSSGVLITIVAQRTDTRVRRYAKR